MPVSERLSIERIDQSWYSSESASLAHKLKNLELVDLRMPVSLSKRVVFRKMLLSRGYVQEQQNTIKYY